MKRLTVLSLAVLLAMLTAAVMPFSAQADDGTPPPTEVPAVVDPLTVPEILDAAPDVVNVVALDENGNPLPMATEAAAQVIAAGDPMWCPIGVLPGGVGCTASFASFGDLITELNNGTGTDVGSGTIYVAYNYDATVAGDAGGNVDFDWNLNGLTDLVVQGGWDFGSNSVAGETTIDLGTGNWVDFYNWGGSLTLNDINLVNTSLYVDGSSNNVVLDNVSVTDSQSGAQVYIAGNVTVNDGTFSGNSGDGLYISNDGNVVLTNVTASENYNDGVDVNTNGSTTVSNGTFFHNGWGDGGSGLYVSGTGDVTLVNVTANQNNYDGATIYTDGNVAVTNSTFVDNGPNGSGLYINAGTCSNCFGPISPDFVPEFTGGKVTLTNVAANGNAYTGATVYSAGGDVTITDSTFSENDFTGLCASSSFFFGPGCRGLANPPQAGGGGFFFPTGGLVTLQNVTAEQNWYDGAVVTGGGVRVFGGSFSNNGQSESYGSGLVVLSETEAWLRNVTADKNWSNGARVDTLYGGMEVDGGSFSENGDSGLAAHSGIFGFAGAPSAITVEPVLPTGGPITLLNVTANGNGFAGAELFSGDSINVTGGSFSNNGEVGILAISAFGGFANAPQGAPAPFIGGGPITIMNVMANKNGFLGVEALSGNGPVTLGWVTADQNGFIGAVAGSENNAGVLVFCGSYSYNGENGLILLSDSILGSPLLEGNGFSPFEQIAGTNLYYKPSSGDPENCGDSPRTLPQFAPQTGAAAPACENPNGEEKVALKEGEGFGIYENLCGASLKLKEIGGDALPGNLPDGNTFVAGMEAQVSVGGTVLAEIPADGKLTLKFPIPAGTDETKLVVLFWDGSAWVEVAGGEVVDGFFVVTVNQSGNYVLATK